MALGRETPRLHEKFVIITLEAAPIQEQVQDLLHDVTEVLEQYFLVRVVTAFLSPLGLGISPFESAI